MERNTEYFTSFETRNYISKQIPQVVKNDWQVVSDHYKILDKTKSLYEILYKK